MPQKQTTHFIYNDFPIVLVTGITDISEYVPPAGLLDERDVQAWTTKIQTFFKDHMERPMPTMVTIGPIKKTTKAGSPRIRTLTVLYNLPFPAESALYTTRSPFGSYKFVQFSTTTNVKTNTTLISDPSVYTTQTMRRTYITLIEPRTTALHNEAVDIIWEVDGRELIYNQKSPIRIMPENEELMHNAWSKYICLEKYDGMRMTTVCNMSWELTTYSRRHKMLKTPDVIQKTCDIIGSIASTPFVVEYEGYMNNNIASQAAANITGGNYDDILFALFNLVIGEALDMPYQTRFDMLSSLDFREIGTNIHVAKKIKYKEFSTVAAIVKHIKAAVGSKTYLDGCVLWDPKETASVSGHIYKYKTQFITRMEVEKLIVSENKKYLLAECIEKNTGIKIKCVVNGLAVQKQHLITELLNSSEEYIPPSFRRGVDVRHFGKCGPDLYRFANIQLSRTSACPLVREN